MPDYFPNVQLPTGLTEAIAQLIHQQGQAWGNAFSGFGQNLGQGLAGYSQNKMLQKQNAPIPVNAYRALAGLPALQPSDAANDPLTQMYGKTGVPRDIAKEGMSLAERMASAKEATTRALGVQGLRNESLEIKDHTRATPELIKNYPTIGKMGFQEGDLVPNRFIQVQEKSEADKGLALEKQKTASAAKLQKEADSDQKQWVNITRLTDPAVATRGSLLGIFGQNNARANRALSVLNDPNKTPQDKAFAITDLAGIMQGGSPHEIALKQQNYGTLGDQLSKWSTYLTGNPMAINQPGIIDHLKKLIDGVKQVDNQGIEDNLKTIELNPGVSQMIQKNPQKWLDYRNKILNNVKDIHVTPQERYSELEKMGLKEDAIYKQMHLEGLQP